MPEPFENVDTTDLTADHRRVIEISRDQFHRHGRADARIVWQGAGLCAAVTYGGDRRRQLPVSVGLCEDGMCYANTSPGGRLLWCVSVRTPNACRVKNGAFWISKIDGADRDAKFGRIHPFMVSFADPRNRAVPYVGLAAIIKGGKAARVFKGALQSIDAEIE